MGGRAAVRPDEWAVFDVSVTKVAAKFFGVLEIVQVAKPIDDLTESVFEFPRPFLA
jgi:hypothetical protein